MSTLSNCAPVFLVQPLRFVRRCFSNIVRAQWVFQWIPPSVILSILFPLKVGIDFHSFLPLIKEWAESQCVNFRLCVFITPLACLLPMVYYIVRFHLFCVYCYKESKFLLLLCHKKLRTFPFFRKQYLHILFIELRTYILRDVCTYVFI